MSGNKSISYWELVWKQFCKHPIGLLAVAVVASFAIIGVFAPFLVSSKPLFVVYDETVYFPLFRYLFYSGFFTKRLDIFFNILIFTGSAAVLCYYIPGRWRWPALGGLGVLHVALFITLAFGEAQDPASDASLNALRQERISDGEKGRRDSYLDSWRFELDHSNEYAKLNMVLRHHLRRQQDERFQRYAQVYADKAMQEWLSTAVARQRMRLRKDGVSEDQMPTREELEQLAVDQSKCGELEKVTRIPTLWQVDRANDEAELHRHQKTITRLQEQAFELESHLPHMLDDLEEVRQSGTQAEIDRAEIPVRKAESILRRFHDAQNRIQYIRDRNTWLDTQTANLHGLIMPLLRPFHWEDDAGGEQDVNQVVDWWELTRINRKDLVAGLIFGIRVSLVVGIASVTLALIIGVPIGAAAGFYGGRTDIIVSRMLEIWESMPVLFMLLMVVAVTQNKSIFLVIAVVGIFGWTGFSRFIRGEFFKQRNLPYVESCQALGFGNARIIFAHILPNAIPPLLTLLPFAIMGAITSEAGLSFLGLGEEGSCSWGVLMDEGRTAFPGESYLLWPPAIMLTVLLVAIALVGDALRDALDPKMRS